MVSATETPPEGAGPLSVTVAVDAPFEVTDAGFSTNEVTVTPAIAEYFAWVGSGRQENGVAHAFDGLRHILHGIAVEVTLVNVPEGASAGNINCRPLAPAPTATEKSTFPFFRADLGVRSSA